jgi:hypothetical protein
MTAGILLVALTLVDLRACATFAAQPSTEAVPSKTYKSEQFKFSFDYPASWSVQEKSTSDRSQTPELEIAEPGRECRRVARLFAW